MDNFSNFLSLKSYRKYFCSLSLSFFFHFFIHLNLNVLNKIKAKDQKTNFSTPFNTTTPPPPTITLPSFHYPYILTLHHLTTTTPHHTTLFFYPTLPNTGRTFFHLLTHLFNEHDFFTTFNLDPLKFLHTLS